MLGTHIMATRTPARISTWVACLAPPAIRRAPAGGISPAADLARELLDRGDGCDGGDGNALLFEDGPLLDVQLDEGVDVAATSLRHRGWVEPAAPHGLRQAHSGLVGDSVSLSRRDQAGDGPRAPEVRMEAAGFLVADRHQLQRPPREPQRALQRAQRKVAGD